MDLRVGASTNVGNVRDHNEDSFCVNRKLKLFIVADGMGGHAAGEIASSQLKDFVEEFLLREDRPDSLVECLTKGIQAANRSIYQMGLEDPKKRGMGTTATVFTVEKDRYVIAHVGDSRCYLVREGELFQITRDHSRVYQLYESGLITKEEMEDHPMSNVITRSIGNHATVDPDIYEGDLAHGDRFLLCSDGLTGEVKEKEIEQILLEKRDPQAAVELLIQRALEEGGKDNVTCLVMDVREGDDERRKTVPLTLEQLKKMPAPAAVVEEVDLESRRRAKGDAEAEAPEVLDAGPRPRGEGRRRDTESGLAAAGILAGGLLLLVGLALWWSQPRGGGLHLTSEPPGAEVYLDNQYRGSTPLTIDDLEAGTYQLRVQCRLGKATRTVQVAAGRLEPIGFRTQDFRR